MIKTVLKCRCQPKGGKPWSHASCVHMVVMLIVSHEIFSYVAVCTCVSKKKKLHYFIKYTIKKGTNETLIKRVNVVLYIHMQSQVRGPSHMLHHLPGIPFPFSQITQHPLIHFLDHVFEAVFLMSVMSDSTCIPYKHCVMRFTPFTLLYFLTAC